MSGTTRKLLPSSTLRGLILDGFYKAWELHPDPEDYFPVQQIWDEICAGHKGRVNGPLVEGAFNGLLREELVRAIQPGAGPIAARTTDLGRSYREELLQGNRTRFLAHLGVCTGALSLVLDVLSKVLSR